MTLNRLADETSPYLLQHKDNPVHWWAWGPEALDEAKASGKPILLSVGYAACHWCHVMAHESFEDEGTAAVMNLLYVNIKVDREERPDIDAIYMGALHALGEQGGWPLTMFLDGDARPFFGGTYFPKDDRYGRPSFVSVLKRIALVYSNDRKTVDHNAEVLTAALTERPQTGQAFKVSDAAIESLVHRLTGAIDMEQGGLKGAPKFPQWSIFWLLWRGAIRYGNDRAKAAVISTLANISQGGIYDHLGGGFSRYSVDERWLVPHFEKMLYDNALLIDLLREVHLETGNPLFEARISETVQWLSREMTTAKGGFASSLDADSEGEEGKFYVWTATEVVEVLGAEDGAFFCQVYDVTPGGNWEGDHHAPSPAPTNILNRLGSLALMSDEEEDRLSKLRFRLLAHRSGRVRPGFDDKVLADWNGLMIASLSKAGVAFKRPEWILMAERAFAFVSSHMSQNGRLLHSYRAGKLTAPATASDYANMIAAALAMHQATLAPRYLEAALAWLAVLETHYWAPTGGYATSADDTADVIARLVAARDDAMPNANAMMVSNLMHLFLLTGDSAHVDRAEALVGAFGGDIAASVVGHTGFIAQALDIVAPALVVCAQGAGIDALWDAARVSVPGALGYQIPDGVCNLPAGLARKSAINSAATAYVCLGPQCCAPITDPAQLREHLISFRTPRSNQFINQT